MCLLFARIYGNISYLGNNRGISEWESKEEYCMLIWPQSTQYSVCDSSSRAA